MKKYISKFTFFWISLIIVFSSCQNGPFPPPPPISGVVPDAVIPPEIRSQLEDLMPIYSGTTPPDISGEFLCDNTVLVGSSLEDDSFAINNSSYKWSDLYLAFIKSNGKYIYKEQNGSSSGGADDVTVTVTVVGKNKNFTAFFTDSVSDVSDNNYTATASTVISGTMNSDGISDFYYAFIMLEKTDPNNVLVPVNTYRVFNDGDGLAENYNWTNTNQSASINKSFSTVSQNSIKAVKKGFLYE